jgi:small subunit ribosomal protein S17
MADSEDKTETEETTPAIEGTDATPEGGEAHSLPAGTEGDGGTADGGAAEGEAHELPAESTPGEGDATEASAEPAAPKGEPQPVYTPKERRVARRTAAVAKRGPRRASHEDREAVRKQKAEQRRRYRAKQKVKRAEARAAAPAPEPQHAPEHGPGRPKVRQGVVVSDKADKTITVRIDVTTRHRRYHKIMRHSTTLHAHDETNNAHEGDTVRIIESRPLSRTKRWRLVEVLERAK